MENEKNSNIIILSNNEQDAFASGSMRDYFSRWLCDGSVKKYSVQLILSSIDKISDYAVQKKISVKSIWEYNNFNVFKQIYMKLIEAKLLRVIERNNYKIFIEAGKLYLSFLKEKPWKDDNQKNDFYEYDSSQGQNVIQSSCDCFEMAEEILPIEKDSSAQVMDDKRVIFSKVVDWSLLNYGFTVPQKYCEKFCNSLNSEVLCGNSYRTTLIVNDIEYKALINSVSFSNNNKKQLQVRYSANSDIAITLRKIFRYSYEYFFERNNNPNSFKEIKGKEYVELVVVSSNKYKINCFSFSESAQNKYAIIHDAKNSVLHEDNNHNNNGFKYAPLKAWLNKNDCDNIQMTFSEIGEIVGGLPSSAYKYRSFWSNSDSQPFASVWMSAGYTVTECNLKSGIVNFQRSEKSNSTDNTRGATLKTAFIEFSNRYKGEIKTRREIVDALSTKYEYNEHSILPADFEMGVKNQQPKLFKRIQYGTYLCLGYNSEQIEPSNLLLNQVSQENQFDDYEYSNILNILDDKFKHGFRMSSNIDFERFKNYYNERTGCEFQYNSDRLHNLLNNKALVFDDRAYFYSDVVSFAVREYIMQMKSSCIYIDIFFNEYSAELYAFTIFSIDMLRAFIKKYYYDIFVKWDYILLNDNATPSNIIKDVFTEREIWTLDELQERLPYIKMDTIRQILNGREFYRVDKGTYTHIDHLDLPESEGVKIQAFVADRLLKNDYVIANELELRVFENLNPHCSFVAIRDAVFYKFLLKSYDKSGQIITKKGQKLRVLDILERYCSEVDSVSFDELNSLEVTFDPEGRAHSQSLIAGYNTLVRVSKELFVAEEKVIFDVQSIDDAIAIYCHDNFIPLREITDFSLFPHTGYRWNLYLLESYTRRFSYSFKFDVRAVNSANIGAIVRKSFEYNNYDEILSLAIARSAVDLSDIKMISDYLFTKGLIGWRNLGKSEDKIIEIARKLRKEGNI